MWHSGKEVDEGLGVEEGKEGRGGGRRRVEEEEEGRGGSMKLKEEGERKEKGEEG